MGEERFFLGDLGGDIAWLETLRWNRQLGAESQTSRASGCAGLNEGETPGIVQGVGP